MNIISTQGDIEPVKKMIEKYLPAEYFPGFGSSVMVVLFLPQDKMSKMAGGMHNTIATNVRGLTLDMQADLEEKTQDTRFMVYLSESLLADEKMLLFTLLHEFGHVDHFTYPERLEKWKGDRELYADMYAFDLLDKDLGLMEAVDYLGKYASKHGFHKALVDKEVKNA